MTAKKLLVSIHGHQHEVAASSLEAELSRQGPPPRLPLLEALLLHAPRERAIARLISMIGHGPGDHATAMYAALGLLGLAPRQPEALAALHGFGEQVSGAAGATVLAGVRLLREGPKSLAGRDGDPLLLRQSTRAVAMLREPGPFVPGLRELATAWLAALAQAAQTSGAHAFRAFAGDIAEALYRVLQRSQPPCRPDDLLSEEERGVLLDTITSELPSTSDFLAARAMVWLLGSLGPPDDAGIAAIERARDRFKNEEFHADCATILSGGQWPGIG